jgi:hypothetical protein
MSNERHAAVLLHAMSTDDREWIMDHLSAGHRAQLTPMLSELTDLGIPRQQELLLQLQDRAATKLGTAEAQKEAPIEVPASPNARAGRASVTQLKTALLQESPAFIAAALFSLPPDRRSAVIAALTPAKAERVEARLARPVAPALAEAAVALLADALKDTAPEPSDATPNNGKHAPRNWTRGWAARMRSLPWR